VGEPDSGPWEVHIHSEMSRSVAEEAAVRILRAVAKGFFGEYLQVTAVLEAG
jgi:hypothetical protein